MALTTRLSQAINSTQTTINILQNDPMPVNGGFVTVDSEQIQYTTASDSQLLGCVRGVNGTTAAAHVVYATVTFNTQVVLPRPQPAKITYSYFIEGTTTITGPTGAPDGQPIIIRLLQDAIGHTVTFASGSGNFNFGTDLTSFTASGANLTDYVGCIWNATQNRWNIVSIIQGF